MRFISHVSLHKALPIPSPKLIEQPLLTDATWTVSSLQLPWHQKRDSCIGFSLSYSGSDTCHILLVQTVDMAISNSKGWKIWGKWQNTEWTLLSQPHSIWTSKHFPIFCVMGNSDLLLSLDYQICFVQVLWESFWWDTQSSKTWNHNPIPMHFY